MFLLQNMFLRFFSIQRATLKKKKITDVAINKTVKKIPSLCIFLSSDMRQTTNFIHIRVCVCVWLLGKSSLRLLYLNRN